MVKSAQTEEPWGPVDKVMHMVVVVPAEGVVEQVEWAVRVVSAAAAVTVVVIADTEAAEVLGMGVV